eukprot:scaffold124382_cov72-Phaeocystis_antarctica.AAC.3
MAAAQAASSRCRWHAGRRGRCRRRNVPRRSSDSYSDRPQSQVIDRSRARRTPAGRDTLAPGWAGCSVWASAARSRCRGHYSGPPRARGWNRRSSARPEQDPCRDVCLRQHGQLLDAVVAGRRLMLVALEEAGTRQRELELFVHVGIVRARVQAELEAPHH